MSHEPSASPPKGLELSLDYACNARCVGCHSSEPSGPGMTTREAVANLALGQQYGVRFLWLGGGEPTLRADLVRIVTAARRLGYDRIKLQTNGMLLARPGYLARLAEAGVTEVNFSLKGPTAAIHDAFTRAPGCHALMLEGMREARRLGLALEGDVLAYRRTVRLLPDIVRRYLDEGLGRFDVWMFSCADPVAHDLEAQVPLISELVQAIVAAAELGPPGDMRFVRSLHTPRCTLPPEHRDRAFHAAAEGLLVANPGARRFQLESSAIEGGMFLPSCATCSARPLCSGIRVDYARVHGTDEFRPIVDGP